MLTNEDIAEVLNKFQKLENIKKAQAKASSGGNAGRRGSSILMMALDIPKDQLVWFKNPNANEQDQDNSNKPMYLCHVVKLNGDKVVLRLTDDEKATCKMPEFSRPSFEVPVDCTLDYSLTANKGLPDMVEIDELNHATLMQNLHARYTNDQIYTYVGPIILAMNPFKNMDKALYSPQHMDLYKGILTSKQPYEDKKTLPPHIWTLTALAYRQMMEQKSKQAIVISGESGSGKTENAKRAMKFLTGLGASKASSSAKKDDVPIEQKILDTNPVLESFGNAKTVRNNNSSRFGKYVLLYFTQEKGEILGARVKNYLLEKSRVVGPSPGERNYHVFYHLLRGADEELLSKLGLLDPSTKRRFDIPDFNYLKNGADVDQAIVNDKELYAELAHQFISLGFTNEEQLAIWKVTAACLHLGEITFDDSTYDENGKPCSVKNMDKMSLIAGLLGFKAPQELITEIVNKAGMPGQTVRAPLKKLECQDSRDSLAKCLFDNMFNWLVERMNLTILPESEGEDWFKKETKTIGLLDIFGFENFQENQFEQMCINYVNEKLHKLYISAIFDAEKFELKTEGLQDKVSSLKYPDLTSLDVIRLLDEKPATGAAAKGAAASGSKIGLFNIVNDCSTSKPRPQWEALMKKFEDQHKNSTVFLKEKVKEKFKIRHSAKEVIYTVKTFIDRNVDEISTTLEQVIIQKGDPTIGNIFSGQVKGPEMVMKQEDPKQQKGGTKKTIWSKFSAQMQDLMFELAEPLFELNKNEEEVKADAKPQGPAMINGVPCENCQLHFIRCIKPNEAKKPDLFIHAMTLQQVTYMGVLESVDLKQKNFPYRKNYEEFYARYELLSPLYGSCRYDNMEKTAYDFRQLSINIVKDTIQDFGQEYYALGRTKIFMMLEVVALFDKAVQKMRQTRDQAAIQIKRAFSLNQGLINANRKKQICLVIQAKLKLKCLRRLKQRGQAMFRKVLEHVSKSVSIKQEEYARKATQVFADTYRKHIFRRALARRIKVRQSIINFFYKFRFILQMRKLYIGYTISREIADRAFMIGKSKANERAVRTVQRIFRGFNCRDKRMPLVINAMKIKENLKLHVAAKVVQKRLRGFIVRTRMELLRKAAQKVQAFVKMKWHREFYLKMRADVMTIQRCVRRFLTRRVVVKARLQEYLSRELHMLQESKNVEQDQIYSTADIEQYLKPPAPYSLKKITFFTRVLDLHVITDLSDIYPTSWAAQWKRVNTDCNSADAPILFLSHGTSHTLAVNHKGKLFAWGWNDNGQCAQNQNIFEIEAKSAKQASIFLQKEDLRIKQVVVAQERNFILLEESQKVIVWGGNEKGQLGLGNYDDQYSPKLLDYFHKQGMKITMLAAGGDMTMCASENGEGYAWPFLRNGITYSLPVKMPFSAKIKIAKVSCGFNFGFFLSSQGLIYAVGKDNSEGQLGLGHVFPRDVPELITSFKDIGEKIDTIECGYKHVIAKSSLGKIYTWGWGAKGQLGHGHVDSEISPRQLLIERNGHKERVIQVAAGFSHSIIMVESRDLLWFGTCEYLSRGQTKPISIKLYEHMPEMFTEPSSNGIVGTQQSDFAVVKITSSWSRGMSLTNFLLADLRQVNTQHPWKKIQQSLQAISQKWEPRDIMPPYIEQCSGLFNANMIKIPGVSTGKDKQIKKPVVGNGSAVKQQQTVQKLNSTAMSARGNQSQKMSSTIHSAK